LITNPSLINGATWHPYFCCLIFRYFFLCLGRFSLSLSLSLSRQLPWGTNPISMLLRHVLDSRRVLDHLQASSRSVPMFISRMQNSNLLHRYERSSRIMWSEQREKVILFPVLRDYLFSFSFSNWSFWKKRNEKGSNIIFIGYFKINISLNLMLSHSHKAF